MEDRCSNLLWFVEWQVMSFGLTNGPTVFQCFMNVIVGDMLDVCIVVYLDNFLIYSDNLSQHREHIVKIGF
jgi:Reverse transcriptase (RNA-dependent DNA polymerase)